ncbi:MULTISPECIES: terminase TerL endonuclease subunit [unclassified Azospirillum]|uniref:terminase TerL endonuclease subunit n=1 Tax=unclassified Azospirillum TaxID=2630922 RepID=UPI0011B1C9E8|nr:MULTISPECIES: terminase TerL endonuclease subunit [unclassified Azospirillum]
MIDDDLQADARTGLDLNVDAIHLRQQLGGDRLPRSAESLKGAAARHGVSAEDITIATFGQRFASMAVPAHEPKRAILGGEFRHGGAPVLRMFFANVVAEKDAAENEKFTKENARGRIDGAVAAAMAVGRILAGDEGPSIYETADRPDGFLVVGGDEEEDAEEWEDLLLV